MRPREAIPCKVIITCDGLEVKESRHVQTTASNPVRLDIDCVAMVATAET